MAAFNAKRSKVRLWSCNPFLKIKQGIVKRLNRIKGLKKILLINDILEAFCGVLGLILALEEVRLIITINSQTSTSYFSPTRGKEDTMRPKRGISSE